MTNNAISQFTGSMKLEEAADAFEETLAAKNRSQGTIVAYRTDLAQFIGWLHDTNVTVHTVDQVERGDITDYLAHLGRQGISGVSRARKLSAIRELFRFLEETGEVVKSPALSIETPKREKNVRTYLATDEYRGMLSLAGASPRDYAIIQVFLQTGIRVSELCELRLDDVNLKERTLTVRVGKGMSARVIDLERKGIKALKTWIDARAKIADDHLFLNRYDEPIGERGVKKLITKYAREAGIKKRAGCHSLRHTYATHKAKNGVTPYQLQEWLGHRKLDTTMIYVHLGRQPQAQKVQEATSL